MDTETFNNKITILNNKINDIVLENHMLKTEINKLAQYITTLENKIDTIILQDNNYLKDSNHPKNNPPLCINRYKDFYEWIEECE
jgi:uncharacterized protein Yka (UPF0111/DUF47 family)